MDYLIITISALVTFLFIIIYRRSHLRTEYKILNEENKRLKDESEK